MSDDAAASRETKQEANKNETEAVRSWMDAIEIATKEESDWVKRADETVKIYRSQSASGQTKDRTFNILHSNIETTVPAVYNSTPVPDVRRRYQDNDPAGKEVADIIERCISYSVDAYDFDDTILAAVQDEELVGRGVTRIRYVPYLDEAETAKVYEEATCEHVQWRNFRRGPGKMWADVPWIAFELFLTRDQLVKLSPKYGNDINLDCTADGVQEKNDGTNKEIYKRAKVWEIWDKDARKVIFIAESKKDGPIRDEQDPLGLTNFFPIPRPIYAIRTSNSLVPVIPYDIYRDQAEELEKVSARIMALVDALKAKGVYDGRLTELARVASADDNELVAIENAMNYAEKGGLEAAISWWPIETIAKVLEKLYVQRDQIKQAIYEITGIADILRGQSDPNETLGAQEIKQQWGSLRIQRKQMEVQRYARDLFELKTEVICGKFEWQTIELMTGLKYMSAAEKQQAQAMMQQQPAMPGQPPAPPPQLPKEIMELLQKPSREDVEKLLRDDATRGFRIDVESDSTIRADMTRNQTMMSQFLEGTASYMQAVGPAVVQGFFPPDIAVEIYSAFARNFRLGKQAEDALDRLSSQAKKSAEQPPKPDPKAEAEKIKAEAVKEKAAMDSKAAADKAQLAREASEQAMAMKEREAQLREREMEMEFAHEQRMLALKEREAQMNMAVKVRAAEIGMEAQEHSAALDREATDHQHQVGMEATDHKHQVGMEVMEAKAKMAKQKPKAKADA